MCMCILFRKYYYKLQFLTLCIYVIQTIYIYRESESKFFYKTKRKHHNPTCSSSIKDLSLGHQSLFTNIAKYFGSYSLSVTIVTLFPLSVLTTSFTPPLPQKSACIRIFVNIHFVIT